jgi:dolichol-phosphate mannosyltransferase
VGGDHTDARIDVSVVSPVYGCAVCLEELVDRIEAALRPICANFEIILVDDASPDGAWARMQELAGHRPSVRGVRFSRNFGQHAAISAGLLEARGDTIIVMDCDLQDRPEEIPKLLSALSDKVEIALAQRVDRQDSALKRFWSWCFYRFLGWLTGAAYDHTTANFGAYGRRVVNAINAMPEHDRFFPMMAQWTGFETARVPVVHESRGHGKSGYNFRRLLRLGLNIALSYSDKPLMLVVSLALCSALLAIGVAIYSIVLYAEGKTQVAGFTSIIASVWILGSAILASIGVVGLYVGRLFNSAKGRPHFVIAEKVGTQ